MTNKIEGYEDSHPVNCYGLRFTSAKTRGYDGEHPLNKIWCNVCDAATHCTVMGKCGKCYDEQNGGDELSGDASTRKDEVKNGGVVNHLAPSITATSPTYTREELAQIMAKEFHQADENGLPLEKCWGSAIDALIALGEVRAK